MVKSPLLKKEHLLKNQNTTLKRALKKIAPMLLFLCFGCQPEMTFPVEGNTVDEIVNSYIQSPVNAGVAIGTIKNGNVKTYLYGTAEKSTNQSIDNDTIFEIGSITKVFTTALLADMESDGLLSLNDPVEDFIDIQIPEYNGQKMTLYHLATHTAGFPPAPSNLYSTEPIAFLEQLQNPYKNYTENNLYEYLIQFDPSYPFGTKIEYSNTGIALLGKVLEEVSEMPYQQLLQERVLEPLDMNKTSMFLNFEDNQTWAQGYNQSGVATPHWEFQAIAPAGAICSTLSDMLIFLKANIDQDYSSISEPLAECHTPQFEGPYKDYEKFTVGLGWIILPLEETEKIMVWHNGGTGGFRSFLGFVKETETGVIVLSNSACSVDDIGRAVLKLLQ